MSNPDTTPEGIRPQQRTDEAGSAGMNCSALEKVYLIYRMHTSKAKLWRPLWDNNVTVAGYILAIFAHPFICIWFLWRRLVSGPIRDIARPLSDETIAEMRRRVGKPNH